MYVTSAVKFFVGIDSDVNIDYELFANDGLSVTTIQYSVLLKSTLGTSTPATFSTSPGGSTITVGITELLAGLPVGGNVLQESDLEPGDTFTFDFVISLSDGRTLNTASNSTVTVQCPPAPGDYRVVMHDSYGDGWQTDDGNGGSGLQVTLDDGTVLEVGMCSPYLASDFTCVEGDGYDAEDVITIPDGTKSADWYFPGDSYGEISFEIFSPAGVELFASGDAGAQGAGLLPIINCR